MTTRISEVKIIWSVYSDVFIVYLTHFIEPDGSVHFQ